MFQEYVLSIAFVCSREKENLFFGHKEDFLNSSLTFARLELPGVRAKLDVWESLVLMIDQIACITEAKLG